MKRKIQKRMSSQRRWGEMGVIVTHAYNQPCKEIYEGCTPVVFRVEEE